MLSRRRFGRWKISLYEKIKFITDESVNLQNPENFDVLRFRHCSVPVKWLQSRKRSITRSCTVNRRWKISYWASERFYLAVNFPVPRSSHSSALTNSIILLKIINLTSIDLFPSVPTTAPNFLSGILGLTEKINILGLRKHV